MIINKYLRTKLIITLLAILSTIILYAKEPSNEQKTIEGVFQSSVFSIGTKCNKNEKIVYEIESHRYERLLSEDEMRDEVSKLVKVGITDITFEKSSQLKGFFNSASKDPTKSQISWDMGTYSLKISIADNENTLHQLIGNIELFDKENKKDYNESFQIKRNESNLLVFRSKLSQFVLSLQYTISDEKSQPLDKEEATYHTTCHAGNLDISSSDAVWHNNELSGDTVTFNNAKAVIKTEKGEMTVLGKKMIWERKKNELIVFDYELKETGSDKLLKGKQIKIPIENSKE